jgi:sirohydrochlorin ferrochelatase
MTALAADSVEPSVAPQFLIVSDLQPHSAAWTAAVAQMEDVRVLCAPVLGFDPDVRLTSLRNWSISTDPLSDLRAQSAKETFVLPAAFDFGLCDRDQLGQRIAEQRRHHPDSVIHHDDVDPGHPLVIEALGLTAMRALGDIPPQKSGLILAASGHGDAASRAQTYCLMRHLWERWGFARAEVAFVRNAQPFLPHVLERCVHELLPFIVVFQGQWQTEHVDYARVILENFQRSHSETAQWAFARTPDAHPMLNAWYAQRIASLWREKRAREALRAPSLNGSARKSGTRGNTTQRYGRGLIARIADRDAMAATLQAVLPPKTPKRVLIKVTWHGYAPGTYTDPAALDLLLSALPARAVVLEGHTISRNLGGASFDWETEARENRAWIRQQEGEYLRRTGIQDVLTKHRAEYLNISEAFWDEDGSGDAAQFVPKALLDFRGCPMLSFAKFKGPTRLGISNFFGLIPLPLRSAWHGPNITWFARACCEVAKSYGSLFELCAIVEGLYSAVRWNRRGLYRSRWGNYDLIRDSGYVTASRGLVAADILASRLQGQDVHRSAFFDVVRSELGWDPESAEQPLPEDAVRMFS